MNLEKFHAVVNGLLEDEGFSSIPGYLQNMQKQLQNKMNQPQEAQHQTAIADVLKKLSTALSNAKSNSFPPTWRQVMDDLDLTNITGQDLLDQIDEIFARNQITDAVALEEIKELARQTNEAFDNVQSVGAALNWFEVGMEELEPGEAQLALLVPRDEVNNSVEQFAQELFDVSKLLGVFSEIATDRREQLKIRAISSSDFGVFIDLLPQVAAQLATVVEKIVGAYKLLLELREIRDRLRKSKVPDDSLQDLDQHINKRMQAEIRRIAKETIEQYEGKIDGGRQKELEIELRISMNGIANRLDRGFSFEVTAQPLDEPEEGDEPSEEEKKITEQIQTVIESSDSTKFLKLDGSPILKLPEKLEDDD